MSNFQLSEGYVDYILDEFDASIPPHQILHAIQYAGQKGIQLDTIVECLHQYGRIPYQQDKSIKTMIIEQPVPAPAPAPVQTPLLPVNIAQIQNPVTKQTRSTQRGPAAVRTRRISWNMQADILSLAAYRAGQGLKQIKAHLRSHGYKANLADIAASLRRQGEQDVRLRNNKPPSQKVAPPTNNNNNNDNNALPVPKPNTTERICTRRPSPPAPQHPVQRGNTKPNRALLAAFSAERGIGRQIGDQMHHQGFSHRVIEVGARPPATLSLKGQEERDDDIRLRLKNERKIRRNFRTWKYPLAMDAHRVVETVVTLEPLLYKQDRYAEMSDAQIYTILSRSTELR